VALCNAITNIILASTQHVGLIAVDTDIAALAHCLAPVTICIGDQLAKGLGAGGDPAVGRRAAECD